MSAYAADGFFVLRAPRLPLAPLDDLRARAADPAVRDALAHASPGLAEAAAAASRSPGAEASLTRYLARMSGRPTPRGLLAGVSTGRIGGAACLRLQEARPVTRLSAGAAIAVAARLEAEPALRGRIPFWPNPSIHAGAGGRLHYVEARPGGGHALVSVSAGDEPAGTLAAARGGATLAALTDRLVADGVAGVDAEAFVEELVAAHLLVSSLAVPACGPEPGAHLLARLRDLAPESPHLRDLEALETIMQAADRAAPGQREAILRAISPVTERLGVSSEPHRVVHVDLVRDAPGLTLPREVADALLAAVDALRRVERGEEPEEIGRFRDVFRERYGERRVALLEALDPDLGIGFGDELAVQPPSGSTPSTPWGPLEQLRLRLVTDAAAAGLHEVDLASALPSLAHRPAAPLPEAFSIMAALAADSEEAVTAGDYEARLFGVFGPSGARLLGRFCHRDAELRRLAEQHLRAEEALHPDALFAEIAHLPAPAVGDIVSRPALRSHEIRLLGAGGGDAVVVEPGDLDVGIEDGELVLRDGAGRRVLPRLTSAHHVFGEGLGLYRFLALLQFQHVSPGLAWSWGPLEGAAFLPRVRLGRVVLEPARWRVAPNTVRQWRELDPRHRVAAVTEWRARVNCPRHVGLPAQESALQLELDDPACVETLLREAPPDGHAVVQEWWPEPERSPVTGPGGRYAHELLIPFTSTREPTRDPVRPRREYRTRRALPPGSDWLFAKLYTTPPQADALIAHDLGPLARAALDAGVATSWHFLRYADPEFHVRLRLHGDPEPLREAVLPRLFEASERLMDDRRVRRVVLDTYDREIERYGGDEGIVLAERIFHADSDAVATLLAELPHGEEPSRDRWQIAAAGVWSMFRSLGLQEPVARALSRRLRDGFAAERGLDRAIVRELARGLRAARPAIEALLDEPPPALRDRDAKIAVLAERFNGLAATGALSRTPAEIAGDLAHMHCNRLLRASPRAQELRIHDALVRTLEGRAARARAGSPVP